MCNMVLFTIEISIELIKHGTFYYTFRLNAKKTLFQTFLSGNACVLSNLENLMKETVILFQMI